MTTTQHRIQPYVYASVFSSLLIILGVIWDVSWHTSIGRDSFFAPPHNLALSGVVFIGLFAGYQVIRASFFSNPVQKQASIKFWWIFHGSIGSLFTIWGALAMLTSIPFDNWWHATYGLDTLLLSPSHTLLFVGMAMIQFGAMLTVMSYSQTTIGSTQRLYQKLFVFSAGLMITTIYTLLSDSLNRSHSHTVLCYQVSALVFPLFLIAVRQASPLRWAATATAATYMAVLLTMQWFLPLFPITPRLGPILNHITHYQPFNFPMLLAIPAIIIDILLRKQQAAKPYRQVFFAAVLFLLVFFVVQWYFGAFLLTSPAARGWFFGSYSWYFGFDPEFKYRYAYAPDQVDSGFTLVIGMLIAAVLAMFAGWVGFKWGRWMKGVQR